MAAFKKRDAYVASGAVEWVERSFHKGVVCKALSISRQSDGTTSTQRRLLAPKRSPWESFRIPSAIWHIAEGIRKLSHGERLGARNNVRGLSRDKVPVFLQFVTGSSLVLVPRIEVALTTLSGIQRCPIVHTCSCRVDLSTEYESFAAFCKKFDTVISKEEYFQYNAI